VTATAWASQLWSSYETAVASWQTGYSTTERPSFWELGLEEPGEAVLEAAARDICDQIEYGILARDRHPTCLVLFHLLRTRLTNVRGNRLWPEVAEELERLAGRTLSGGRCDDYFRKVIRDVYEAELDDNLSFRYVRFALDETGVGKDRSRIVREYLESVLQVSLTEPAGNDLEGQVDQFHQSYVRNRADRGDVEALARVLRRSSLTLLQLAADLRTRGLALECSLWDWVQLRSYWLERTGLDLNRLLPEAKDMFGGLLQRLGDRVSREGLARLLAEGRLKVRAPAGVTLAPDPRRLALMPVRLEYASARRELIVSDHLGLTADAVLRRPPNSWQLCGNDWTFFWRTHPFTVRLGPWTCEPSVPLYTGRLAEARQVGHFWSGSLGVGELPVVDGTNLRPAVEPRLRVAHFWWVSQSGLTLQIAGFRADFFDFANELCLSAGTTTLWRGRLRAGVPIARIAGGWRLENCQQQAGPALEIALGDDQGRTLIAASLPLPSSADFLAVDGRVHPDKKVLWIEDGAESKPFPRGILLFSRRKAGPNVDHGHCEKVDTGAAWRGFMVFRIFPDTGTGSTVRVRTDAGRWLLRRGRRLALELVALTNIVRGNLELSGEDGLRLVEADDPILVRLHGWPDAAADSSENGVPQLRLRTETGTYLWSLSDLARHAVRGETWEVSLRVMANALGVFLPFGWMSLRLEGNRVEDGEWSIYRLTGEWIPQPARQGERARLALLREGQVLGHIDSDAELRWADLLERKRVWGRLPVGGDAVLVASWRPPICDVGLFRGEMPVTGPGPLDVTVLSEDVELRWLGEGRPDWTITLDNLPGQVPDGIRVPLTDFLARTAPKDPRLILAVTMAGDPVRSWTIDLAPVQTRFLLRWEESGGGQELCLRVQAHWFGMPGQALELCLMVGSRVIQSWAISAGPGHVPLSRSFETVFSLLRWEVTALRDAGNADVTLCLEGRPVAKQPLAPPPIDAGRDDRLPEEIKKEIVSLWSAEGRSLDQEDQLAEQTLYLSELYLRQEKTMPFPSVTGMERRLDRRGTREVREAVAMGYRLLERLGTTSEPSDEEENWTTAEGKLGLFLLTLWAVHQTRLKEKGEAEPERFGALASAFASYPAPDGASSVWAHALCAYCRQQEGELGRHASEDFPDFSPAQAEQLTQSPLVGFDCSLNRWLETMHPERVSR